MHSGWDEGSNLAQISAQPQIKRDRYTRTIQDPPWGVYLPLRIVPPALLAERRGGGGGKLDLSKIRAVGTIRLKTKLLLG